MSLSRWSRAAAAVWLAASVWLLPARASLAAPGEAGRLYVLNFGNRGELLSPGEVELARAELAEDPDIRTVVILSYGWSNDGQASHSSYIRMIRSLTEPTQLGGTGRVSADTAVIAVGWDSSQTGFRKLFNNLIPLPGIANFLAWLPDRVLFPISFWSKAAQADRIGFGGLRVALNRIFEPLQGRDAHPDIVLMGHSFGTRIVSSLVLEHLGIVPVRSEPFIARDHVALAMLFQPAAVPANLYREAPYPVIATMSRHDRANGFLFPIANIPLNAFGFSAFEALLRYRVFRVLGGTVDTTVGAVGGVLTGQGPGNDPIAAPVQGVSALEIRYPWWRTLAEAAAIPASLAFTLVATPLNYGYVQVTNLATRPVDHLMDTFAQLPVIEVPVALLDRALEREVPWGQRSQGLLMLGPLQVPVGRLLIAPPFGADIHDPVSPDELRGGAAGCGMTACRGLIVVDASDYVTRGMFGENLGNPFVDFTIGWLDPIGAHADYTNPEMLDLMRYVFLAAEAARTGESPASEVREGP